MKITDLMQELEQLGKERTKKIYCSHGAREPLFGVTTGSMKPLFKQIKLNQPLAEAFYATGNYDAMYFAGMIAEPNAMTEADYERWMENAYFYMLSDFVVAVTLAEAEIGEVVAEKWMDSDEELKQSAGWHCYCWMLGNRKDDTFSSETLSRLLKQAQQRIHTAPKRVQIAMNYFVTTVGVSYKPLHEEALQIAKEIGPIEVKKEGKKSSVLYAYEEIQKNIEKNRIGFKRKHVRC